MILEEKIKRIRENENLSQEAFAERLHVSRQSVINWEKGKSTPSFEILLLIANEFHIEINSLVQNEREVIYLSSQKNEIKNSQKFSHDEIKRAVLEEDKAPLYIPKQMLFLSSFLSHGIFSLLCLFVFGLQMWIFIIVDSWSARWIYLIFFILFFFGFLYNFTSFIMDLIKRKEKKCYFYQEYYFLQRGLKEKEYFTANIEYFTSIRIEQSLFGKILNYGDIEICFYPQKLRIHNCKKPYQLKKFVQETYLCKEDFTEK